MKNKFNPGDLVFELTARGEVLLSKLSHISDDCVSTDIACYTSEGINEQLKVSRLFHATPENHSALATLYGEDAIPELHFRGSELTKELLKKQKYVLCLVSQISDDKARSDNPPKARTVVGADGGWFESVTGEVCLYAVPINNNGSELTGVK